MFEYPISLAQLRADLGFFDAALPVPQTEYLEQLIRESAAKLEKLLGVPLFDSMLPDAQLIAMHAAWRYRSRVTGAPMPDMLRQEIRDRKVDLAKGEEVPL